MLVGGFLLLIKGADWFVEGASSIAARLKVSQLVIGLTVVAMGTSLPEAAISISAAFKGSAGIAVGNIVGSNIMNIGLILGITAIITPLAVQKTTRRYEIPLVIAITALLMFMGLNNNVVTRLEGAVLLGVFALYLIYTFKVVAGENVDEEGAMPADENPCPSQCCMSDPCDNQGYRCNLLRRYIPWLLCRKNQDEPQRNHPG